eukprot:5831504-Prymnesium_polylepis.1
MVWYQLEIASSARPGVSPSSTAGYSPRSESESEKHATADRVRRNRKWNSERKRTDCVQSVFVKRRNPSGSAGSGLARRPDQTRPTLKERASLG